jgi:DNA-binding transcriptional LysR family regulator
MDQLYMLRAFAAAAQHRSFSKAAASLGVTTGSISKAIAKLEANVQTRLLHRTTRSVTLTEAAQSYYQSCCRLLEELDEANRRIAHEREFGGGMLRLVVHPMLAGDAFLRFMSSYRRIAPDVNLTVSIRQGAVNLYDGSCDVAILPPHLVEQSAVIRRTLSKSVRILVAAPRYLGEHGTPRRVPDLSRHWLLLDPKLRLPRTQSIELLEEERPVSVQPKCSIDGDELLLRTAAVAGTGVALLPEALVRDDIALGRLVHVLPGCQSTNGEAEICLFYCHRELLPARFRTFVDHCVEFFRADADASRERERITPPTSTETTRLPREALTEA